VALEKAKRQNKTKTKKAEKTGKLEHSKKRAGVRTSKAVFWNSQGHLRGERDQKLCNHNHRESQRCERKL